MFFRWFLKWCLIVFSQIFAFEGGCKSSWCWCWWCLWSGQETDETTSWVFSLHVSGCSTRKILAEAILFPTSFEIQSEYGYRRAELRCDLSRRWKLEETSIQRRRNVYFSFKRTEGTRRRRYWQPLLNVSVCYSYHDYYRLVLFSVMYISFYILCRASSRKLQL